MSMPVDRSTPGYRAARDSCEDAREQLSYSLDEWFSMPEPPTLGLLLIAEDAGIGSKPVLAYADPDEVKTGRLTRGQQRELHEQVQYASLQQVLMYNGLWNAHAATLPNDEIWELYTNEDDVAEIAHEGKTFLKDVTADEAFLDLVKWMAPYGQEGWRDDYYNSNARKKVVAPQVTAEHIDNIAPLIQEAGAGVRPLVIMVENHMGETASLRSIREQLGDVVIVHSSISYAGLLAIAQEEEVVHSRRAIVLTAAEDMQPAKKKSRKPDFHYPALEELRKRYPRRGLIVVGKVDRYPGKPEPTFPPPLKEKYGRYDSPRDEARFWLIAKSAGARLVTVRDSGWVGYSPNQLSSSLINRLERLGPGTPVRTPEGKRYYVGPVTPRQADEHGLARGASYEGVHLAVTAAPGAAKLVRSKLGRAPLPPGAEIWSEYDVETSGEIRS